jgi:hypothetical protein
MSWSFRGVGTPAALKQALDDYSESMGIDPKDDPTQNLSRYEFDHAKPHMGALLDAADPASAVALDASGYASVDDKGAVTPKDVKVRIEQLGRIYT